MALGREIERCGPGRGASAREGEAAEVGMGTTPAREGHGVGRGVGRCGGAGWGARRAAARERGEHRGRRGHGHPLHVRNRRMCRPRRGARRLRRWKRRRQRAGGCSARARQLHGERGRAWRWRVRGKDIKDDGKSDDEEEREKGGLLHVLATPCSALPAAHARRRHDRPASANPHSPAAAALAAAAAAATAATSTTETAP